MSPEQAEASALGVDTRSDIYSLGVLLYELLTGSTPLSQKQLKEAAYGEILRMIKEEEPPRPSTRLSDSGEALASISALRKTEPAKLTKLVRGELDWIVMKSLEKDRNRRYETANGFAADVQRYLNDETVQACPPSALYRFRKFARRHKVGLAMAGMLSLILVTLVGGIGWNVRDRAARRTVTEQKAGLAIQDAIRLLEQKKWGEARSACQRAEGLLAGADAGDALADRLRELQKDVLMVLHLEEIRMQRTAAAPDGLAGFDDAGADTEYTKAFREYDIDVDALTTEESTERLRKRSIPGELATALDEWAQARRVARRGDSSSWRRLLTVARALDGDRWRNRLRD